MCRRAPGIQSVRKGYATGPEFYRAGDDWVEPGLTATVMVVPTLIVSPINLVGRYLHWRTASMAASHNKGSPLMTLMLLTPPSSPIMTWRVAQPFLSCSS